MLGLSSIERDRYLDVIADNGAAIARAVRVAPDTPVPSCPDWRLRDLGFHVGSVLRFWAANVQHGRPEPPKRSGDGVESPRDEELEAFVRGGVQEVMEALAAASDDTPAWNWWGDTTARWIPRLVAHETGVHRWDAENAVRAAAPMDAELAADGIVEFFDVMMPWTGEPPVGFVGTISLELSDTGSMWQIVIDGTQLPTLRDGGPDADAILRGRASDVLLVLWRRLPQDAVETQGDAALIKAFLAYPLLQGRG